jgi:FkbM family methyltransferase
MMDFTRQLALPSQLRYLSWKVGSRRDGVTLTLKSGQRFFLGPLDYGVAYEVFVHQHYRVPAEPESVKLIVDMGGNVGLTTVWFLGEFALAKILAFEPHPRFIEPFRRNVALNGASGRVTLYPAAASNAGGNLPMVDLGTSSALSTVCDGAHSFRVDVVDVFPLLIGKSIDILKMDIEGAEYAIMADPRFEQLEFKTVVMEWHRIFKDRDDRSWCMERLARKGYAIHEIFNRGDHGMLWATR